MINKKFETEIVNLEALLDYSFSIPTYQRPYVWDNDDLKKLFDDFRSAFSENKNEPYFIGTFLTKQNGLEAELIDGQQRFTTLWLISYAISKLEPTSRLNRFLKKERQLRLRFDIRDEVEQYFKFLLGNDDVKMLFEGNAIANYPYLKNIASGLTYIESYLKSLKKDNNFDLIEFGNFIFEKIYLVKNTTPSNTDLNKLFSTINNSGVQLEQTDILKAELLKIIDDRVTYGRIWETCENMNDFFERNVRVSFPKSDFSILDLSLLIKFDKSVFRYDDQQYILDENEQQAFTVDNIDLNEISKYKLSEHKDNAVSEDRTEVFCRSILDFGQLLLHTYRIHLKLEVRNDFQGSFHTNRLLEIFEPLKQRNDRAEIKRFFERLWEIRFLFDKYIIKWVTYNENKNEILDLLEISRQSNLKNYYKRSVQSTTSSMMLQSVLYFTADYLRQYWLTSYLGYLYHHHDNLSANSTIHLVKLESIDNQLSLNRSLTGKVASLQLIDSHISKDYNFKEYLRQSLGTGFYHYWFFKLEYILWKNWANSKDPKFIGYRITSKNSIEHLNPQKPKIEDDILEDRYLNSFGNLVLLSVAQNSEYSNKYIDVKEAEFNNKPVYDTLKSAIFFREHKDFERSSYIEKQESEVIDMLAGYYS